MTKDTDSLLRQRRFEPPRAGFEERILAAARFSRREQPGMAAWLMDWMALFAAPQPAFALAAMLVIGVSIGMAVPPHTSPNTTLAMQSYLDEEGDVL